ncbi:MAG: hypothetical protein N4A44_04180 [Alphaproteobacteria bacterium]|jgi:ASC-1-like (ASCH) protein|nr:hypothetical protein [Alphaproteobacteria bacterium]
MQHIAIMNKKWKLIDKILSGEKSIESRWYVNKISPWGKIKSGEVIYFKDAGDFVTAVAEVENVIYFSRNLDVGLFNFDEDVKEFDSNLILEKYGDKICIQDVDGFDAYAAFKNYCILVAFKNAKRVEPFDIDKTGFGNACAWLCVDDVNKIKKEEK